VSAPRIFLASDYGLDDEFVGVLHAVIAREAPEAVVVDLAHGIAQFDVAAGAALLARVAPHLGPGVLVAVVDPGVGTPRRAVAIEVGGSGPRHLIGPDNGLLLDAAACLGGMRRAVTLPRRTGVAAARTFDGRDVFAPAAARLARGEAFEALGEEVAVASLVSLPPPVVTTRTLDDGRVAITTAVRWIDRFGNVQLALRGVVLEGATTAGLVVRDEDVLAPVVRAYADLERGTVGLLRDANDAVAIVVGEGSAASRLRVAVGDRVELVGAFGPVH
jgi:S-adenosylmethionine hydrolase